MRRRGRRRGGRGVEGVQRRHVYHCVTPELCIFVWKARACRRGDFICFPDNSMFAVLPCRSCNATGRCSRRPGDCRLKR